MKKLILATALLAGSAHAEFMTGNDLLDKLTGTTTDQVLGLGYILGVFDASRGTYICPPGQITAGQTRDIVKGYLERTPQQRHNTGDLLVVVALGQVWPCKKGNGV
jgi:hypothetical protein